MRVREPVLRTPVAERSSRLALAPPARTINPGIASKGVPRSRAFAMSTIVSSPSPITHRSISGVELSVNSAAAVMCSPPAMIGTRGKRRRAIWIMRRTSGQSCENMQLTPMSVVSSWMRSTISSLRNPSAMTFSSNSVVTWKGFSPMPSTIRGVWPASRRLAARYAGPTGGVSGPESDHIGTRSGGRRMVTIAIVTLGVSNA